MLRFLTVVLLSISLSLKGTVWTDCRREFETAAEVLHKDGKDPATTAKQARIIGDVAAFIASKDVTFADETGGNAVENNWLEHDAIPSVDELEKHADKSLLEMGLAYNQASIEEGVKETKLWNETATTMAPYAAMGTISVIGNGVPLVAKTTTIISGIERVHHYGSIALDAGWPGLKAEFQQHPILTTMDVSPYVTVSNMVKVSKGATKAFVKTGPPIEVTKLKSKSIEKIGKKPENVEKFQESTDLSKIGRQGKRKRLIEISKDWKTGKADKGWIKQEQNHIKQGGRGSNRSKILRNPPGKVLAHKRGKEAAKGFDYSYADLQENNLHKIQHKYDNLGKKNK